MATFFKRKRRRTHTGPNKNEKKVLRGQEADRLVRTAGLMKDRFPSVQRLTVQLDFVTPQQHLLDRQTRVFNPTDVCDFSVSCPGRCGGQGAFDLEAKIKSVIDSRQARAEGSGTCAETLY
ncbi:MAG TPA: hypothetical protein P5079_08660, partial [Elusimicrobiota bacterium]|nr:hypothetical protein [Elusimicrobiota bacterium]